MHPVLPLPEVTIRPNVGISTGRGTGELWWVYVDSAYFFIQWECLAFLGIFLRSLMRTLGGRVVLSLLSFD